MYKLIALLRGWREAADYDMGNQIVLVVYHLGKRKHFTGKGAWKRASISPPKPKQT